MSNSKALQVIGMSKFFDYLRNLGSVSGSSPAVEDRNQLHINSQPGHSMCNKSKCKIVHIITCHGRCVLLRRTQTHALHKLIVMIEPMIVTQRIEPPGRQANGAGFSKNLGEITDKVVVKFPANSAGFKEEISMRPKFTNHPLLFLTSAMLVLVLATLAPQVHAQSLSLVYVESNITSANGNSVIGFSNDGLGNLTPLPGSPYLTNGTGVANNNLTVDAESEVITDPEGTLLFAVNGNSNNISAFTINSDGSLALAPGAPFASGGTDPASLAFKDNAFATGVSALVVLNKASDPAQPGQIPNYTTFKVKSTGFMQMNAGSTWTLPSNSSPGQALMSPEHFVFFGIELFNNTVSSYQMNRKGLISQLSQVIAPVSQPAVLGSALHPTKRLIYVGLPLEPSIGVFGYDTVGNLKFFGSAANTGVTPCWLTINPEGTRVYSAETGSGTMTVYDITNPTVPVELQHLTVTSASSLPTEIALDPTEQFMYVLGRDGNLHVLNVGSDGTLSETISPTKLNLPSGTVPLGMAVLQK